MDFVYRVLKKLTFPGTFLKKTVELLLCLIFRIPAPEYVPDNLQDEEEFFGFESFGHTQHSEFLSPFKAILYCFISTIFCGIVGLALFFPAVVSLNYLDVGFFDITTQSFQPMVIVYIISAYLGISVLSNTFPESVDASEMWFLCIESFPMIIRIILFIPCQLLRLGSFLERTGITTVILIALSFFVKLFM